MKYKYVVHTRDNLLIQIAGPMGGGGGGDTRIGTGDAELGIGKAFFPIS